jgi:VWFA-related protein
MGRLTLIVLVSLLAAGQTPKEPARFQATTRLVVVNVEVKDRNGKPVEDLTRDDFELTEDGKPQKISVFEYQRLEIRPGTASPAVQVRPSKPNSEITPSPPGAFRYQDRRLLVLYFDLSSMPAEDQIRARTAAEKFIREKMTPVDLVAIMSFSSELKVLQDFTDDRDWLMQALAGFRIGETSGLAGQAATGETEESEDTGAAFTADETEFNIFNTGRKLSALESATRMLASLPEKKGLVYFSSGVGKTGVENQSQLRATVNAAVRANVSFYSVDTRGLVAEAPLGDARSGGTRGSSMYSGSAQRERRDTFLNQQETLFTLAADTGGKALLDSNDLSIGIVQAQRDISSYYTLGYYSTNTAEDGKYRRIAVRVKAVEKAKLDYRSGYFAAKRFEDFNATERERQLEEALLLEDPITDLDVALEVDYFRRDRDRYIVPLAVKIPGSQIRLAQKSGAETTRLDFIGQVRNIRGFLMGTVRDHIQVKLRGENTSQLSRRNLEYDSAFTLPSGEYVLKFLVRENETGKMGTFETKFEIPNLDSEKSYLKLSSVVWSNQREPLSDAVGGVKRDKRLIKNDPLVRDREKLIPSITKVFRKDQTLRVFFEVYNPGMVHGQKTANLKANVSLYRAQAKVFESEAIRVSEGQENRYFLPVEFEIPLANLEIGRYVCQLNVIDEAGRKFAFRRTPLVLLPAALPQADVNKPGQAAPNTEATGASRPPAR